MTLTIGFTVAAEHVRHFRPTTGHLPASEVFWWSRLGLDGRRMWQQVERTGRGTDFGGGDPQVAGGGGQAAMTKQQLNGPDIGAGFEQVDGEGMSKAVR